MSRKRIRGLRRHWRHHRQRALAPTALSLECLAQYHFDRAILGLRPWTVHGKPPAAFRQLWVSRLLADFWHWHAQLTARYPDFYLAIWLFEPRFGKSQVTAGVAGRKRRYEDIFGDSLAIPLPPEYRALPGVAALRWTTRAEEELFTPEEFAELGPWYSRKPHQLVETPDGPQVAVQVGWVWIGKAPDQLLACS